MERRRVEWPTVWVAGFCYGIWGIATAFHETIGLTGFAVLAALATTLHSSLQHEAVHGHPFRTARLNAALVFPALGLFMPYGRFKSIHLRHHCDARLTDPYDDPESFYLARRDWASLSRPMKVLLSINNCLIGRLVIGPALYLPAFWLSDLRLALAGERHIWRAWALHGAALVPVLAWLTAVGVNPLVYALLVAYPATSLLMLRTFAEHQAHEIAGGRTAIIEASPFFGLLFLNNNLHFVHHQNPRAAWYDLPRLYRRARERIVRDNCGYVFSGYGDVLRRHAFRPKEPVAHPHLRIEGARAECRSRPCRCMTGRMCARPPTRSGGRSPSGWVLAGSPPRSG